MKGDVSNLVSLVGLIIAFVLIFIFSIIFRIAGGNSFSETAVEDLSGTPKYYKNTFRLSNSLKSFGIPESNRSRTLYVKCRNKKGNIASDKIKFEVKDNLKMPEKGLEKTKTKIKYTYPSKNLIEGPNYLFRAYTDVAGNCSINLSRRGKHKAFNLKKMGNYHFREIDLSQINQNWIGGWRADFSCQTSKDKTPVRFEAVKKTNSKTDKNSKIDITEVKISKESLNRVGGNKVITAKPEIYLRVNSNNEYSCAASFYNTSYEQMSISLKTGKNELILADPYIRKYEKDTYDLISDYIVCAREENNCKENKFIGEGGLKNYIRQTIFNYFDFQDKFYHDLWIEYKGESYLRFFNPGEGSKEELAEYSFPLTIKGGGYAQLHLLIEDLSDSMVIKQRKTEDKTRISPHAGKVLINEINVSSGQIEIFKKEDIDLEGWILEAYDSKSDGESKSIGPYTKNQGRFLVLELESIIKNKGAIQLLDKNKKTVDFIRWGVKPEKAVGYFKDPLNNWTGFIDPGESYNTLARKDKKDNDTANDWILTKKGSMGQINPKQRVSSDES